MTIDHPARDIPERRFYNRNTREFVTIPAMHLESMHLQLEHSLLSMRKYEARTHRAFTKLDGSGLNQQELVEYIKCMTVNSVKNEEIYGQLTMNDLKDVAEYMQDPNSAYEIRGVRNSQQQNRRRPNTVESIYYAMIQYGIWIDCEKWHLNSLLSLIDYCYIRGGGYGGGKKRSEKEMLDYYRAMNEANRKKYHSRG